LAIRAARTWDPWSPSAVRSHPRDASRTPRLREQGNPVSPDIMPRSTHLTLSDAGWRVFLEAFEKAAAAS